MTSGSVSDLPLPACDAGTRWILRDNHQSAIQAESDPAKSSALLAASLPLFYLKRFALLSRLALL